MTLGYLMYTLAPSRELLAYSRMGKNILFRPAGKIKFAARVGRNLKQAAAISIRPSRARRFSSSAFSRCR
jgi:hypothetical protein